MSTHSLDDRRGQIERYDFRRVSPHLRFGTASDRTAAWIDQIYPRDVWAGEVQTRRKPVGGRAFDERMLPIASAEDYFQHFGVLEIDSTYYRPLLEETGKPTVGVFQLEQYADAGGAAARFILKAPQTYLAPTLRRRKDGRTQYVENPDYLNAKGFTDRFLVPAQKKLGVKLAGIILEQPYVRAREAPPSEQFIAELDRFIAEIPEAPYQVEIRSAHQLVPRYAEWLAGRELGFCFSHWQWLPPIIDQWRLVQGQFTSASGQAILRLMQPRDMSFADSYALAHPFDAPAPGLADTPQAHQMVQEATALAVRAAEAGVTLNVIANNRAWGNAPDLARSVASRFLDAAASRGL